MNKMKQHRNTMEAHEAATKKDPDPSRRTQKSKSFDAKREQKPSEKSSNTDVTYVFPSQENCWEDCEECCNESTSEQIISRTDCLINDYKQFRAARIIQARMRGWIVRHILKKKHNAAKIIQREWRRFYVKRMTYRHLEQKLQDRLVEYYKHCAVQIQSLWRGWWVREHIHDQYRLQRLQARAAQELLHCVAFKLHYMLRTYQIPGVYSLRNSHCLSKIEQLLAAMNFKHHNTNIRFARSRRERVILDGKKVFEQSAFGTKVPYAGPNYSGVCESKCQQLYSEVDADSKMHKILSLYERANNVDPRVRKLQQRHKSRKGDSTKSKRKKKRSPNFCSDVVKSMMQWKILNDKNMTINKDVFKTPENVENFLREMESTFSLLNLGCRCETKVDQLVHAH